GDQLQEDVQQVIKSTFRRVFTGGKLSKPKSFHLSPFLAIVVPYWNIFCLLLTLNYSESSRILKIGLLRLLTTLNTAGFNLSDKKLETMKKYLIPVFTGTGYLLVYIVAIGLELHLRFILLMFSLSPLLIL